MTKFNDASMSSGTTGQVSLGTAVANAIGTARSGMPSADTSPASALAKLTPQETNGRMEARLERISGRRPVFGRRMLFPQDGPAYSITEAASWKCDTESQQNEALAAVEFALRPATEDDIAAAVYTLRIMTRGRDQRSEADREAEAIIWIQHLGKFPADIVLTTLRNWPLRQDGQWWPTWHDVQREIDAMAGARRLLADHIRSGACLAKPEPRPDLDRDDSPEGVAYRQAVVERNMRKLTPREPVEATSIVEDYDDWEKRKLEEIRAESRKGAYRLSPAARKIYGVEDEPEAPSLPNADRRVA